MGFLRDGADADGAYSLVNSEYEYIALHRDVGETELKQGREIKAGGNLVYVDSAAVRAVKHGRILIIEGIEKAERGIMPVRASSYAARLAEYADLFLISQSLSIGSQQSAGEPRNVRAQTV